MLLRLPVGSAFWRRAAHDLGHTGCVPSGARGAQSVSPLTRPLHWSSSSSNAACQEWSAIFSQRPGDHHRGLVVILGRPSATSPAPRPGAGASLTAAGAACAARAAARRLHHELLAELGPYMSLPHVFYGRRVIHYVDNESALCASVSGYSNQGDSSRLVNMLHVVRLHLRCSIWFLYVPSESNMSDWPSRGKIRDM